MKKLGKLTINPEKVIKNEELVNLRGGGYSDSNTFCSCSNSTIEFEYFDCNCDKAQQDRNISNTCMEGGTCICNPCA